MMVIFMVSYYEFFLECLEFYVIFFYMFVGKQIIFLSVNSEDVKGNGYYIYWLLLVLNNKYLEDMKFGSIFFNIQRIFIIYNILYL